MAHFLIAQVKVNDDSWIPDYAANVREFSRVPGSTQRSAFDNIPRFSPEPLCPLDIITDIPRTASHI